MPSPRAHRRREEETRERCLPVADDGDAGPRVGARIGLLALGSWHACRLWALVVMRADCKATRWLCAEQRVILLTAMRCALRLCLWCVGVWCVGVGRRALRQDHQLGARAQPLARVGGSRRAERAQPQLLSAPSRACSRWARLPPALQPVSRQLQPGARQRVWQGFCVGGAAAAYLRQEGPVGLDKMCGLMSRERRAAHGDAVPAPSGRARADSLCGKGLAS